MVGSQFFAVSPGKKGVVGILKGIGFRPIDYLVPPQTGVVDAELRQETLERFDLDGSGWEQFGSYLSGLARGDLGISVVDGRSVSEVVTDRLGWSVLLVGTAVVVFLFLGNTIA